MEFEYGSHGLCLEMNYHVTPKIVDLNLRQTMSGGEFSYSSSSDGEAVAFHVL